LFFILDINENPSNLRKKLIFHIDQEALKIGRHTQDYLIEQNPMQWTQQNETLVKHDLNLIRVYFFQNDFVRPELIFA